LHPSGDRTAKPRKARGRPGERADGESGHSIEALQDERLLAGFRMPGQRPISEADVIRLVVHVNHPTHSTDTEPPWTEEHLNDAVDLNARF